MRMFEGEVRVLNNPDGGLRIVFEAMTGEVVAADISAGSVNEFRRAAILPQGEHLNMSQIKKVTQFLKEDMPALNKTASDLHERAVSVHARAGTILTGAEGELNDLEKEIEELEAEMRQGTNFPPKDAVA